MTAKSDPTQTIEPPNALQNHVQANPAGTLPSALAPPNERFMQALLLLALLCGLMAAAVALWVIANN